MMDAVGETAMDEEGLSEFIRKIYRGEHGTSKEWGAVERLLVAETYGDWSKDSYDAAIADHLDYDSLREKYPVDVWLINAVVLAIEQSEGEYGATYLEIANSMDIATVEDVFLFLNSVNYLSRTCSPEFDQVSDDQWRAACRVMGIEWDGEGIATFERLQRVYAEKKGSLAW